MISNSNTKLGKAIWSFNIPAVSTCPGKTSLCLASCYANKGHFRWPKMRKRLLRHRRAVIDPRWPQRISHEIRTNGVRILRLHASGDLFSAPYIRQWLKVVRANRRVTFYAYSRSWRIPKLLPFLLELSREPNFVMFFSVDRETGWPKAYRTVYTAYMQIDDDDLPGHQTDVVFRVKRKTIMKKTEDGLFVCPVEQGTDPQVSCSTCQLCFSPDRILKIRRKFKYVRPVRSSVDRLPITKPAQPRIPVRKIRPSLGHARAAGRVRSPELPIAAGVL